MAQINKQQLKDYFRRGNKPTESQFEDLIESNINFKDSKITIDTDQNIGLDVDNPIAKLHVTGTLQLEGKTDYTGAKGTLRWTGTDLVVKTENEDESASWRSLVSQSGEITVDGDVIGIGLVGQSLSSRLHLSGPVLIDNTTKHTNEAMLNVMGSVGIGTNQPESTLHSAATYNQSLSGTVSGVQNDYNANLTGTVDGTMGNTTLTGTGTSFTSELAVHQKIRIDGGTYTISSITDDTTLVLNENLISEVSGQPVSVCELTGTGTIFDIEIATGQQIQIGTNVYTILKVISATCIRLDKALLQDATNATVYITGDLLKVQDIDEATVLTIDKEGNVGIGTTPSAGVKLEVDGNTTLDGTLDVTGDTSVSTLDSTGTTSLATDGGAVDIASSGATTTVKGTLNVDEAVTLDTTLDVTGATTLSNTLTVSGTGNSSFIGNVGIGTSSPSAKLEVNGGIIRFGGSDHEAVQLRISALNTAGVATSTSSILMEGYEDRAQGIYFLDTGHPGKKWFAGINYFTRFDTYSIGYDADGGHLVQHAEKSLLTVKGSTGNVGIGTNNPQSKLDVEGGVAIGATYSGTHAAPSNGLLVEGNVGIGTTPSAGVKLEVDGDIKIGGGTPISKIITGIINSNGTKALGSGFTSTRTSSGRYRITFDSAFSSLPVALATDNSDEEWDDNNVNIRVFENKIEVAIRDIDANAFEDSKFSFIAIGL